MVLNSGLAINARRVLQAILATQPDGDKRSWRWR